MPKIKKSECEKRSKWISEARNSTLFQILNENLLFCKACGKSFKCEQKSHLTQHESNNKHKMRIQQPLRQTTVRESSFETGRAFNIDLCNSLIAANIPWTKLNVPKLREFFEKYCGRSIPSESTLRKNYLSKCYEETIKHIQIEIGNSDIWICVDESTDRTGRYIGNMVIGKLSDLEAGKSFLLSSKSLTSANSTTLARFVNDSLGILWPNGIKYNKVKLLLSDGAAYMLKCGRDLKIFYPQLIHFTCLAHALNLVCETVRKNYENVDGLISNVKKVFLKAPMRVQHYKNNLPDIPLPPEPVLTRWGTWLEAAMFYGNYFDEVKNVVCQLETTSLCVEKAIFFFNSKNIKNELIYIKANFKILVDSIKKLETKGLSITQSLKIVETVKISLEQAGGEIAKIAVLKLKATLNKNPAFETFMEINRLMLGSQPEKDFAIEDWSVFKYAPVTSCDVERSFSWFKNILSEKRTNFTLENLEQYFVCHANNQSD